jgi:DNA-binding transcriptional ArsR family regulator
MSRNMEISDALDALGALSQETRLKAFKLLVEYGHSGAPAGDLAAALDVPHNTLSFHLAHLERAGLVRSNKVGRCVIYSVQREAINGLVLFLNENCCERENVECLNIATTKC